MKMRQLFDAEGRRARAAEALHEFCLVGWYSTTLNANGDVVTCCILQDHKTAVLGSIHASTLAEVWNGDRYERFRAELREIMARRGAVGDLSHSCAVESVCAEKDACPARSYYWAGDTDFRREFHRIVEEMPVPGGAPFAALPGTSAGVPAARRLPTLPVR